MRARNVPFFNYAALFKEREDEYMGVIKDVLSRGAYILQKDLETFEKNLAAYLDVEFAYGVADLSLIHISEPTRPY